MLTSRMLLAPVVVCLFPVAALLGEDTIASPSARWHKFLSQKDTSELVMRFAHPTAALKSTKLQGTYRVTGPDGRIQPGKLALKYRFQWKSELSDADHTTTFLFYFSHGGKMGRISATSTCLFSPFFGANALMELIKDEIRDDPDLRGSFIGKQILATDDARTVLRLWLNLAYSLQAA